MEIQLACRLLFVDMEGLSDGRAVKAIVPQVNPRKMVHFLPAFLCFHPTHESAARRSSSMHLQLQPALS